MLRQFSVVIHDVPSGSKSLVQAALHKLAKKYVIALEQYNHQEGYHLHLFYYLKSPSTVLAQVRKWQAFKWGRVQADPMRGSFDQASVYVISADKVKHQDPSPIIYPPISDQDGRFCDCGYTTHMRYSFAAYQKLIDHMRSAPAGRAYHEHETIGESLQSRLEDWYTACICRKHKKFSRHANDIFPQEIKSLCKVTHGGTQIREENGNEENLHPQDGEDQWYGGTDGSSSETGEQTDGSCSE
jgi:hypothetical protein